MELSELFALGFFQLSHIEDVTFHIRIPNPAHSHLQRHPPARPHANTSTAHLNPLPLKPLVPISSGTWVFFSQDAQDGGGGLDTPPRSRWIKIQTAVATAAAAASVSTRRNEQLFSKTGRTPVRPSPPMTAWWVRWRFNRFISINLYFRGIFVWDSMGVKPFQWLIPLHACGGAAGENDWMRRWAKTVEKGKKINACLFYGCIVRT